MLWDFIRGHLLFFLPVVVPELRENTPEGRKLEEEFAAVSVTLTELPDTDLDHLLGVWKDSCQGQSRT